MRKPRERSDGIAAGVLHRRNEGALVGASCSAVHRDTAQQTRQQRPQPHIVARSMSPAGAA